MDPDFMIFSHFSSLVHWQSIMPKGITSVNMSNYSLSSLYLNHWVTLTFDLALVELWSKSGL